MEQMGSELVGVTFPLIFERGHTRKVHGPTLIPIFPIRGHAMSGGNGHGYAFAVLMLLAVSATAGAAEPREVTFPSGNLCLENQTGLSGLFGRYLPVHYAPRRASICHKTACTPPCSCKRESL